MVDRLQDSAFVREMLEQPQVLRRLLSEGREDVEGLASQVKRFEPSYGILAARGSSHNAARYAQYVLGVYNRLTCALANPSLSTVYGSPPNMKSSITIGLSQSGSSPDVVQVIEDAAAQGAMAIAVTNQSESPLARAAGRVLLLRCGDELAIPATKTYTAELMIVAMLSAALQESDQRWTALSDMPDLVDATLALNASIPGLGAFRAVKHATVLGRGLNFSTACEAALKISETTSVMTTSFSTAEFFHGRQARLRPGLPVLLIAPQGRADAQLPRLLRAVEESGSRLILVSNDAELLKVAEVPLPIPVVPEWLSPICAAVAVQRFCEALASVRSENPDEGAGLSKITLTY